MKLAIALSVLAMVVIIAVTTSCTNSRDNLVVIHKLVPSVTVSKYDINYDSDTTFTACGITYDSRDYVVKEQ